MCTLAADVSVVITSDQRQSWPASSGAAARGSAPGPPSLAGFRPYDGGSFALLPVVWPPPLQARQTRQGTKGKRAKCYGAVLSRRKPRSSSRPPGASWPRYADRQFPAPWPQLPPRMTRAEPDAGPCGSVTGSAAYLPYQSCTHSHTLPCMSYRPQAFGCSCPTGWVCATHCRHTRHTSPID